MRTSLRVPKSSHEPATEVNVERIGVVERLSAGECSRLSPAVELLRELWPWPAASGYHVRLLETGSSCSGSSFRCLPRWYRFMLWYSRFSPIRTPWCEPVRHERYAARYLVGVRDEAGLGFNFGFGLGLGSCCPAVLVQLPLALLKQRLVQR